jgi:hypothetical protein
MREWWKTPEGQAVRAANTARMRDHNPSREVPPDPTGRRLALWRASHPEAARVAQRAALEKAIPALAERRKDPNVHAALVEHGRKLGTGAGAEALRRFRNTPAARELDRLGGERLGAFAKARSASGYFKTPEQVAIARAKGAIGVCKRWRIGRGKPCICGHHGTAAIVVG